MVTLTTPDAAGRSQGCATVDQGLAREIALRGHEFYVNVHTAAAPGRRDPRPAARRRPASAAPGRRG